MDFLLFLSRRPQVQSSPLQGESHDVCPSASGLFHLPVCPRDEQYPLVWTDGLSSSFLALSVGVEIASANRLL